MYNVVRYHIGNSAALNSTTIRFDVRSRRFENTRSGTSGDFATRPSSTANSASSARPPAIGPSAFAEPHPCEAALTIP